MSQQMLFDAGLTVFSVFIGNPIELTSLGDRSRAAQLALLTVLLKRRSGKATANDIVRDSSAVYPDGGKWLGPAIRQLADDGLIRLCGACRSKRTSRNSGLLSEWELIDRKAAKQRVKRLKNALSFAQTKNGSEGADSEPS
ncbi:hypothetical protein [Planctomycetes bacterium K23_9]|uniref:Uncharacterized protein n=1 Tax=Stieleria marina TaxID=1930275 RepID=A0A517NSU3_9BACT|nr:hypothetical protein K239x_21530 [Planctomycetes bacterium K23_9]